MKYPRLYSSLDEFEKMELRHGSTDWSMDQFFDEVLREDLGFCDDFEDDEEEEDY
jgi:hypothetical protein